MKIIGLAIANGFAASQAECSPEAGVLRHLHRNRNHGLRSRKRDSRTQLFHRFGKLKATTAVIAGAILYKACVAFVISMRIVKATDLKLITAAILLLILIVSDSMKRKGHTNA